MTEQYGDYQIRKDFLLPVRILESRQIENQEELFRDKAKAVSFRNDNCAHMKGKGAYLLLDFGRELCGGLRIITRLTPTTTRLRLTFGESVAEACSAIGEKNARNDHSPRDLEVLLSGMSDLEFGLTGFRFARVELLDDCEVLLCNIYAFCKLPVLEQEASIVTNDPLLNRIVETAAYTLKLNFQNGFIWDGIKRDRLVWCGDLHPEILTSLYCFGKTVNVTNSLDFLRENTPEGEWVNTIPTYSAWWVANLCDYVNLTGDRAYFEKHADHAEAIFAQFDALIDADGTMHFDNGKCGMPYYLDWPSFQTPDAVIGTASLLVWTAKKYLTMKDCPAARRIRDKLQGYLEKPAAFKQIRAFQIMAGGSAEGGKAFLEEGCAKGMSTFMAYYILTGAALAGSEEPLNMLKQYYGGMLSRGATSFWEDFDIDWLEGSGRIDELPQPGQKDIHGDYGKYCYKQFRHSLCHGWSSGVLAFIIEHIVGLQVCNGYREVAVVPHSLGLTDVDAVFPTPYGPLSVHTHNGQTRVEVPDGITLVS